MAKGVNCGMQLGALLPLSPVVARTGAALGRGAERAAVEDGGAWLGTASLGKLWHGPWLCAMASKQPTASWLPGDPAS